MRLMVRAQWLLCTNRIIPFDGSPRTAFVVSGLVDCSCFALITFTGRTGLNRCSQLRYHLRNGNDFVRVSALCVVANGQFVSAH